MLNRKRVTERQGGPRAEGQKQMRSFNDQASPVLRVLGKVQGNSQLDGMGIPWEGKEWCVCWIVSLVDWSSLLLHSTARGFLAGTSVKEKLEVVKPQMDMERSLCKGVFLVPRLSEALPFLQGPQSSSWQRERPLSGQRAFTDYSKDPYGHKLYFQGELDARIQPSQGAPPVEVIAGGLPWKWKAQIRICICKDFVVDGGRTGWSVCVFLLKQESSRLLLLSLKYRKSI